VVVHDSVLGHDLHLGFLFRPDGTFERREYIDERGTCDARAGKWTKTVSGTGVIEQGTYAFADTDTVTLQWLTISTSYKRKGITAGGDQFVVTWTGSHVSVQLELACADADVERQKCP